VETSRKGYSEIIVKFSVIQLSFPKNILKPHFNQKKISSCFKISFGSKKLEISEI